MNVASKVAIKSRNVSSKLLIKSRNVASKFVMKSANVSSKVVIKSANVSSKFGIKSRNVFSKFGIQSANVSSKFVIKRINISPSCDEECVSSHGSRYRAQRSGCSDLPAVCTSSRVAPQNPPSLSLPPPVSVRDPVFWHAALELMDVCSCPHGVHVLPCSALHVTALVPL